MIVRLAENPLLLRGWTIVDNRGNRVTVSLSDMQTGLQLGQFAVQERKWPHEGRRLAL